MQFSVKRLRRLARGSVSDEEVNFETLGRSQSINTDQGFRFILRKLRIFLIRPTRQLVNLGLVLVVILSLTVGVMAQGTVTTVTKTGNLSFTKEVLEKTAESYYADHRTVATVASNFSGFALGEKIEVDYPEDLPETSLATVDNSYLAKPNIPVTGKPGTPRERIIVYIVKGGDTIISIAKKFDINTDTILWANPSLQLQEDGSVDIKPGNRLRILPVNGVRHVVQEGETLAQIAAKYHASKTMIRSFNRLESDKLKTGQVLIVPDGEKAKPKPIEDNSDGVQVADDSNSSDYSASYSSYGDSTHYGGGGGFPYGYCTYYVAMRRGDITWRGNAWQWYYNARAQGRPVGRYPVPGAIMVTWESGWGHVAYVEAVYGGGRFTVSEMNYAGWGRVTRRTITTGSVPLIGFIY